MTLKTQRAADANIILDGDDFSEIVDYNGSSIVISIRYEDFENNFEIAGKKEKRKALIMLAVADVAGTAENDVITLEDGSVFIVKKRESGNDIFHLIRANETTRKTLGGIGTK